MLKHTYGRFISHLARRGYNHIDKFDFLEDYQQARLEAFQSKIIRNSFTASGIVPVDERVLSKLNISLRTPIIYTLIARSPKRGKSKATLSRSGDPKKKNPR